MGHKPNCGDVKHNIFVNFPGIILIMLEAVDQALYCHRQRLEVSRVFAGV